MDKRWKLMKKDVCLDPCEELDLELVLEEDCRAAIHGVVKLPNGCPVKDAVVKLFIKKDEHCSKKHDDCCKKDDCELIPVTFTYTDECGQFLFGVKPDCKYLIKVFYYIPECKDHKPKHCKDND